MVPQQWPSSSINEEKGSDMTKVNNIPTVLVGIATATVMLVMNGVAQEGLPQQTKESIKGKVSATTEQLHGTVEYVEGNHLVVRMPDGQIREFTVPASRKFTIDGRDV